MRKTYGATWWGRQWLQALGNIDYANRLPRGRTYANRGAVLRIAIEKNRISAQVRGSRPSPYRVDISVPEFTASTKARILEMVTENPVFLSSLLNRELPNELYAACRAQGIDLFPRAWNDLAGSCSCPDWAVPCKHLAAVLYLVANEIDKNPFLVFELHNFDLFQGLAGIGYTSEQDREIIIPSVEDLRRPQPGATLPYSWNPDLYRQLDFSLLPDCREQLLTLLPEQTVFYPAGNFRTLLNQAYTQVAKSLGKRLRNHDPALSSVMDAVEAIELLLDAEMEFLSCQFRDAHGELRLSPGNLGELTGWLDEVPVSQLDKLAPALRGLVLTYHLAERLALHSAYLPQILDVGRNRYRVRWLPATLNEVVQHVHRLVDRLTPRGMLAYEIRETVKAPTEADYFPALLSVFLNYFVHRYAQPDFRNHSDALIRMFFHGTTEAFADFEQREYPAAIQLWLSRFFLAEKNFVPVLQVIDHDSQFSVKVAIEDREKPTEVPLALADLFDEEKYRNIRLEILKDLTLLAGHFPQMNKLLASRGREPLLFDSNQFVEVLFRIIPTIRLFGIKVLLPKALRKLIRPQVSMLLEGRENGEVTQSGIISLENLLQFRWQIAIGDQFISPETFIQYVRQFSGIVRLNDQYVFFDEREIKNLIEKLESPPVVDGHQLLQVALKENYQGAAVQLDERARQLIEELITAETIPVPDGLKATLRPYQERGYAWLYKNARLGFGSLLADDMGLGKTLQVICTLLKLKDDGELKQQKGLVIVPTTLLTNWLKELEKFAPELRAHLYHGPNRSLQPLEEVDLLLTTYGVLRSDHKMLGKHRWLCVVIDEAQNIKNPATAQTKAVKKMAAPVKIAMSGTPVENRLSEYWSIFDFSNRGYLGNLKQFKETFARPIEMDRDQKQLNQFRQITDPFILRRVKTDRSIIRDLPDKIEKDQYCPLSPEQAALYQNVIDQNLQRVEAADGIDRRGLIFKLMTALKQVCNHPQHFLKKGQADPSLSGKSQLLMELLAQILDNDEKVLIFTQYQEMGKLLATMIQAEFGIEPPFLHGGVSRKMRDAMVEDFQHKRTTRIFLLSLKAGGTGLNLTAASNVIHYDLWWNPAVEAQATDRAYRIGQTRNVLVHRFITQGTFEEKINKLLQSKKELADLTVSAGEQWIGDLSDEELKALVLLQEG